MPHFIILDTGLRMGRNKEFWDRDLEDIESDFLPQGKKITDMPIQDSVGGIPIKKEITKCSFCNRPVRNKYGLDLLGRVYCERHSCTATTWIKTNIINRYIRLRKAW